MDSGVSPVILALRVSLDRRDRRDPQDLPELWDLRDLRDLRELQAQCVDPLDLRGLQARFRPQTVHA
jgi:hypothetical protein